MKGNVAIEYLLVVAVLVLGLAAAVYQRGASGKNLGESFIYRYQKLATEVAKP